MSVVIAFILQYLQVVAMRLCTLVSVDSAFDLMRYGSVGDHRVTNSLH